MVLKILVAVDISEATKKVLEVARYFAQATDAKVRVLHVAEADPDFVGYDAGPEVVRDQVAKEFRQERRSVQNYAEKMRESGIDATSLLVKGPIVATILEQAKRFEADLMIVGSHGFGAIYDLLVGSASRGLLKDTDIPILVVPIRGVP